MQDSRFVNWFCSRDACNCVTTIFLGEFHVAQLQSSPEQAISQHRLSDELNQFFNVELPNELFLRQACDAFQLGFMNNIYDNVVFPTTFGARQPAATLTVPGDGNCLFSSLSLILTGSTVHADTLRGYICDFLLAMDLDPLHFQMYSRFNVSNATEYLTMENMRSSTVFVGDLEIYTFSSVFAIRVVVYSTLTSSWTVYRSQSPAQLMPTVFLFHNNQHWEPIIEIAEGNYIIQQCPSPKLHKNCFQIGRRTLLEKTSYFSTCMGKKVANNLFIIGIK